ncbi:sensor histidine kinase YesM [Neobacillus niacini]|uniref:sensor histidine kinase n=1 Tax=Neobacillus driksii TaxID=3035913 RepID=UPI00277F2394|nr:histidine kinase [Neobacillus niacini]MDQ0973660.1 sensor histidine kinase YesM [Neobacillus niacini]
MNKDKKLHFHTFLLRFSLIAVFVFLLLLSSLYYIKIKDFIEEKKESSIQLRMDQISTELQTEFNSLYETTNNLRTNEIVIRYLDELSGSEISPTEKYYQNSGFEDYLNTIRQNNKLIDNILIITPNTQYSSDQKYVNFKLNGMKVKSDEENNFHFFNLGEASSKIELLSSDKESGMEELNNRLFFGTNIISADGVHKGVILLFINPKNLDDSLFYANQIRLFDHNGQMFFKGEQVRGDVPENLDGLNHDKKELLAWEDTGVYYSSIPFYNFQLIYEDSLGFYKKQIGLMWKMIVLTFVCSALVAIIFSRMIGRKVIQPLYQLIISIKEYEESRNYSSFVQQKKMPRMKLSLQERFFFYFVITVLLPLFIYIGILYGQTSRLVSGDMQESYHSVHEKMARLMNNEINQQELIMARIAFNNNVQLHILEHDAEKIGQQLVDRRQFLELRRQNIKIYDESGKILYTNMHNQEKEMATEFMENLASSGRKISYTLEKDRFNNVTIVIGMPIFSPVEYSNIIGFITVDIEKNQLEKYYSDWQKTGLEMLLADKRNMILSHPNPLKVGKIFDSKEKMLQDEGSNVHAYSTEITGLDWEFISKYNYSDIQKQVNQLFISDLYLFFFIILMLLVFAYWISKRMHRPIGQLNELVQTFDLKGSHHDVVERLSGIEEVDSLTKNFNQMMERMEDLIHETILTNQERIQLKFEKRELQLNALQSQINPHFLYNTLDNLIFLVEANETDKATEMIASLSRFFRFITNREQFMITLRDELVYTKTYIKIMSYRFDNFECVWDVDEKLLNYKTVKLILQPVIENAIHHGARKTKDMVTIHISGELKEEEIHIVVKDNAVGIGEEELTVIKSHLAATSLDKAGIYNVNGRIRLQFGGKYGLCIESERGKGTKVTIVLPAVL